MVKKLKKLLKANWIRRCLVLMSCATIILSAVAPASAFVINANTGPNMVKLGSLLSGSVTMQFDSFYGDWTKNYSIGGLQPYPNSTGAEYYGEEYSDFVLRSNVSPDWTLVTYGSLARYKHELLAPVDGDLITYAFDDVRYKFITYEEDEDGRIQQRLSKMTFSFDPIYYDHFWYPVFCNVFELRLGTYCTIETSFDLLFYNEATNKLVTMHFSSTVDGGNPNIEAILPIVGAECLGVSIEEVFADANTLGEPCLMSNFTVTVTPKSGYSLPYAQFELLSEQWKCATPSFYRTDSSTAFANYLNSAIDRNYVPGFDDGGNVFTSWLANAVSGFFDVEIMPNFSLGGVITAIFAVVIVMMLLKFFAGG